jgi:ABC-type multidrug transport system permease subunit
MVSRLVFTVAEIAVLLTAAYYFFGVKVHGNVFALAVLVFLGGACFAGMGLLIACRAKTLETVSGLMNAVMLPMYVVSGVFFKADYFPQSVQPVIQILPLTALNNGLRAVMNDGRGFDAVGWPALVLGAWGGLSFAIALKLFRWR